MVVFAVRPGCELACPVPPGSGTLGHILGYLGSQMIGFTDTEVGQSAEASNIVGEQLTALAVAFILPLHRSSPFGASPRERQLAGGTDVGRGDPVGRPFVPPS